MNDLPFLSLHRPAVNQLLARTDIVPRVAAQWDAIRGEQLAYRSESELENHLALLWKALNFGLPPDNDNQYPDEIRNAQWKQRKVTGGYSSNIAGIGFDIAAYLQTAPQFGDPATSDTVYLLVEVKNESAILRKVDNLEARIEANVMPQLELTKLTEAEQMLVQVSTNPPPPPFSNA